MIFVGIAALIPAVLITFLAFSKKTSPAVKKAATGALILITLAFLTCTIIIVTAGPAAVTGNGPGDTPAVPAAPETENLAAILIMLAALLFLMILVVVSVIRDQRKK